MMEKNEIFFRNIISSLIDSELGNPFSSETVTRYLSIRDILQMLITFKAFDNYPVLWNGIGRRYITYSIFTIGDFIGRIFFSLKPISKEYTPQWLWDQNQIKDQ
jgi:hypothetical protein